MNWIKRILGIGNSVDAILADFHKVTARLRSAIDFHNAETELHDASIAEAHAVIAEALQLKEYAASEIARAEKVCENIEKMIGLA